MRELGNCEVRATVLARILHYKSQISTLLFVQVFHPRLPQPLRFIPSTLKPIIRVHSSRFIPLNAYTSNATSDICRFCLFFCVDELGSEPIKMPPQGLRPAICWYRAFLAAFGSSYQRVESILAPEQTRPRCGVPAAFSRMSSASVIATITQRQYVYCHGKIVNEPNVSVARKRVGSQLQVVEQPQFETRGVGVVWPLMGFNENVMWGKTSFSKGSELDFSIATKRLLVSQRHFILSNDIFFDSKRTVIKGYLLLKTIIFKSENNVDIAPSFCGWTQKSLHYPSSGLVDLGKRLESSYCINI